jgi:sugar O-acyltransferase (sialic acid O-acetyltransferase NeuD family)
MPKKRLLVVGAGGHGRSVAEAAVLSDQFEVVGFLDDGLPIGTSVLNAVVLGSTASMSQHLAATDQAIVAIGNNALREKLLQKLNEACFEFATVIHPRAIVSPSASLGAGSAVMAGAVLGTEASLGVGTIVNCGAVVDHQAKVEDYGHLGVNASMAGGTVLGRNAWMQSGAAIGYGVCVPPGFVLEPGVSVMKQ